MVVYFLLQPVDRVEAIAYFAQGGFHGKRRVFFHAASSRVNKKRLCSRFSPLIQNSICCACRQNPRQYEGRGTSPG
jgi:hypothetical protein